MTKRSKFNIKLKGNKIFQKVLVTQKNGRVVPINKETKPCPECGNHMYVERVRKGGVHKRSKKYWVCSETLCNHKELEEGTKDKEIRMGLYDETIGLLPLTDTDNI